MAEESHVKMEALKKAYAEVILNTSKEAAVRIMAAERKARSFEQQFVASKQESLSMLLRLKQRFTSMIIEAEERSRKQQSKIEELEAQLSEAEGITVDLRGEIKQLQEQLEIMIHNQKKSLNQHILVTNEPVHVCMSQDCAPSVSDSKSALVDYEKKTRCLRPTALSNLSFYNINSTNFSVKSHLNQPPSPIDDFTSAIMRNRETLWRNGSTQRIHALDGNISNARLPNLPYRGQLPHRSCCYKGQAIRTVRRSARSNSRYREAIASFKGSGKRFGRTKRRPFFGSLKGCLSGVNAVFAEGENVVPPIEVSTDTFQKLHYDALLDSVLVDVPISEGIGNSNCLLANVPMSEELGSNNQLADVPISEGFGNSNCWLAGVPISEGFGSSNYHMADISVSEGFGNSHLADVPNLEGSSNKLAVEDRFLKFTFHRKRRKNVLKTIDKNIFHDRDPMKKLDNPNDVAVLETVF